MKRGMRRWQERVRSGNGGGRRSSQSPRVAGPSELALSEAEGNPAQEPLSFHCLSARDVPGRMSIRCNTHGLLSPLTYHIRYNANVGELDRTQKEGVMTRSLLVVLFVSLLATSAFPVGHLEQHAFQMKEDFGVGPPYDNALQYYYYVPCPTDSWFWGFFGWVPGDILGACFRIGDVSTGGWSELDPGNCNTLEAMRILDFAGYGTIYPGLFTVEFDVYCSGTSQNPFTRLWNSGPAETRKGWNYIRIDPPLSVCSCCEYGLMYPNIAVTMTMVGQDAAYPYIGFDNICAPVESGCEMHDIGCLPAVYPRGQCGGPEPEVHSGYVGLSPFEFWPPLGFVDGCDTTADVSQFGFIEWVLTLYVGCSGPSGAEPSSWGSIKAMYK